MSEFDSNAREAQLTGQRMDEVRSEEWASKREDRDSLRSSLERDTEGLDDPPEKISLDEKPYDRFGRQADIRDDLSKAVDVSFYNSANAEKREKYLSEFDRFDKQVQRTHGVDGVTGFKQMLSIDEGLRSPDFQTRVNTVEHLVNLAHNNSDYGPAAQQRAYNTTVKEIEAVEKKYDIPSQVWDLASDYMATPEFQRTKTGDNEADLLRAIRSVKKGLERVQMR